GLACEYGVLLGETKRFARRAQVLTVELDLDRITQDRMRQNTFGASVRRHAQALTGFRTLSIEAKLPTEGELPLNRLYERFPYVPADPATRDARCAEVYDIQVHGLTKRLEAMKSDK